LADDLGDLGERRHTRRALFVSRDAWRRTHRLGVSAHLDEGSNLGARTLPPSEGRTASTLRIKPACNGVVPRSPRSSAKPDAPTTQPDTAGSSNTEYFVDLKRQGAVASRLPPEQGGADRRHRQGTLQVSRSYLELLPGQSLTTWKSRERS